MAQSEHRVTTGRHRAIGVFGVADLLEASSWKCDGAPDSERFVDELFTGDRLICVGYGKTRFKRRFGGQRLTARFGDLIPRSTLFGRVHHKIPSADLGMLTDGLPSES